MQETLQLSTLDKAYSATSCMVARLTVKSMDGSSDVTLNRVHARPIIPIHKENIATVYDCNRWSHLQGLPIRSPTSVDSTSLLIGMDCPDALIPFETAAGMTGEPYDIRTRLGWSLSGPINDGEGTRHSSHFIVNHEVSPHMKRGNWRPIQY